VAERIASATLHIGDMREVLPQLAADGLRAHCCVTDPPYELGFMGKRWDSTGVAFRPETWRAVFDCLLPGAHLVAFGGTRTFHRMACAIEDAGFEIRDTLAWLYGSGFPKSADISKHIDRAAGAEREVVGPNPHAIGRNRNITGGNLCSAHAQDRGAVDVLTAPATPEAAQWAGWGTALKPSYEPVILARRPLDGTVAANTLRHGCGGLNVAACRVGTTRGVPASHSRTESTIGICASPSGRNPNELDPNVGRWPANVVLSDDPEVEAAFKAFGSSTSSDHVRHNTAAAHNRTSSMGQASADWTPSGHSDSGSPSRFYFTAKADARDRAGSKHPTVKPTDLMRWLVRLVCPPGGLVLDPFAGSGSTGLAADQCGMRSVLVERDPTYAGDALRKIREDAPLFAEMFTEAAD
jgi:DNA modification methylase